MGRGIKYGYYKQNGFTRIYWELHQAYFQLSREQANPISIEAGFGEIFKNHESKSNSKLYLDRLLS